MFSDMGLSDKLPEKVRFALDLGRVVGGLKGLWWLLGVAVTLVANGTLWAWLQTWPVESKVMVTAGVALGVFLVVGQIGAFVKARSGRIDLMTTSMFWEYVEELLVSTVGQQVFQGVVNDPNMSARMSSDPKAMEYLDRLASRSPQLLAGEGAAALNEAVRRGFITNDERAGWGSEHATSGGLERLKDGLNLITQRIPQVSHLRAKKRTSTPFRP